MEFKEGYRDKTAETAIRINRIRLEFKGFLEILLKQSLVRINRIRLEFKASYDEYAKEVGLPD